MTLEIRLAGKTHILKSENDTLTLDGVDVDARFEKLSPNSGLLVLDGQTHVLTFEKKDDTVGITTAGISQSAVVKDETALMLEEFGFDELNASAEREIHSPMPGLVLNVLVESGEAVEEGQGLVVLEAMKMENELKAPVSGLVETVHVAAGEAVGKNALLIELAPEA